VETPGTRRHGVVGDGYDPALRKLVNDKEVGWPRVRVGQGSEAATEYGVRGAPTYLLIGPDGKIVLNSESDGGEWTTKWP
jgi:hypothetical protein